MASTLNAFGALGVLGRAEEAPASKKKKNKAKKPQPVAAEALPPPSGGVLAVPAAEAAGVLEKAARTFKGSSDRVKLYKDWVKQVGRGPGRWCWPPPPCLRVTAPNRPSRTPGSQAGDRSSKAIAYTDVDDSALDFKQVRRGAVAARRDLCAHARTQQRGVWRPPTRAAHARCGPWPCAARDMTPVAHGGGRRGAIWRARACVTGPHAGPHGGPHPGAHSPPPPTPHPICAGGPAQPRAGDHGGGLPVGPAARRRSARARQAARRVPAAPRRGARARGGGRPPRRAARGGRGFL